jgi:RNA polymerase sigma factor for flagellar operon FliA
MTPPELAYKMSATSTESSDELVMQELQQVYYIATRIRDRLPRHVQLEDLVSAGVIGLLEASRCFDSSKNIQFKTFARFRIRGAIFDSLREMDWGSRLLRRRAREIAEVTTRLESQLGRKAGEAEIAAELGMDLEQLHKTVAQLDSLQITGQRVASPDASGGMVDLIESAPSLDDPDAFEIYLNGEMHEHLAKAIATLSEREQLILSLYYREELTMKEIAEVVGVALSRVSQIRMAAILKLRSAMAHTLPRAPNKRAAVLMHTERV